MYTTKRSRYLLVAIVVYGFFIINGVKGGDYYTPIVLWHGMGDSCCFPFSLGSIVKGIKEALPGVYVTSLKIGSSIPTDVENGFFMHPNKQIDYACKLINSDPNLQNGYHAVGFSQGSQFLRALIQRCKGPKVGSLISLGGQHQGVYGLPNCPSVSYQTCDYMRRLLNHAAYFNWVQNYLVQATYWHDPLHESDYVKYSTFLADINNERYINKTYRERLSQIENFVMVKFEKDSMVQPIASEWFGFYKAGQSKEIVPLNESKIYTEDRLGLKELDERGRLHFLSVDGNHLQFNWTWFQDEIIKKYLS
ncbi:palmitoyl-protein thioesterase 1 [Onthophagus taurus]|uniref:palmitoyl-protein thioesterase 1 n=1 Tax=Onthophagus taurus TaxID=166361 RepID=UPI0039BE0F9B